MLFCRFSACFANIQLIAKSASYTVDDIGCGTSKIISDLNGSLGPRQFLNVANEGHVLHCARAHLKVPSCPLNWN